MILLTEGLAGRIKERIHCFCKRHCCTLKQHDFEDMWSLGLHEGIKAATRYDQTKGPDIENFASWIGCMRIRDALRRRWHELRLFATDTEFTLDTLASNQLNPFEETAIREEINQRLKLVCPNGIRLRNGGLAKWQSKAVPVVTSVRSMDLPHLNKCIYFTTATRVDTLVD